METLRRLFCCCGPSRSSRRKSKLLRELEQKVDDMNLIAKRIKLEAIQALNSRLPVYQVRETLRTVVGALITTNILHLNALVEFFDEEALDTTELMSKLEETIDIFERRVEERMDVFDQVARSIMSAAVAALNSRQPTDQVRSLLAVYEGAHSQAEGDHRHLRENAGAVSSSSGRFASLTDNATTETRGEGGPSQSDGQEKKIGRYSSSRQPVDQVRETLADNKEIVIAGRRNARFMLTIFTNDDPDSIDVIRKLVETIHIFERKIALCNPAEAA